MDAKAEILEEIEQAKVFRKAKSEQYPDDHRNQRSVTALVELIEYVEDLPEDHHLFQNWHRVWHFSKSDDAGIQIMNHALDRGDGPDKLSRYGFDGPENPESFCEQLSQDLASGWMEYGNPGSVEGNETRQ